MRIISQNRLLSVPYDPDHSILEAEEVAPEHFRIWADGKIVGEYSTKETAAGVIMAITDGDAEVFLLPAETSLKEDEDYYRLDIAELELSVRGYNILRRANIKTVGDLIRLGYDKMTQLRNMGRKTAKEIEDRMVERGYWSD